MNLRRVRPTKFLGVPRVWEKIAEKMKEIEASNRGIKKVIFNWAKKVAEAHHISIREGKLQSFQSKLSYRLAKKIIFRYYGFAIYLLRYVIYILQMHKL